MLKIVSFLFLFSPDFKFVFDSDINKSFCVLWFNPFVPTQFRAIVLLMIALNAISARTVMNKKSERVEKQRVDELHSDSWPGNYISDWDQGEVKHIMIEKKVPVFVEKIRHVPIIQKEYVPVPRYITKPIYIERSYPIIVPRLQHYHHHHYSEYHHLH